MAVRSADEWRLALEMLRRYRGDAAREIGDRLNACALKKDEIGTDAWRGVLEALMELFKDTPQDGEWFN